MLALWVHTITYGDAAVAVGTLALAAITGYLGIETRATARAAREAVESSEEPFVIATPTDEVEAMTLRDHERGGWRPAGSEAPHPPFQIHRSHEDAPNEDNHFVRLKLWNIGLGPAIVENVILRAAQPDGIDFLVWLPQSYPLGIAHIADIEIAAVDWPLIGGSALIRIIYTHASGRRYESVSLASIKGDIVTCKTYERSPLKGPGFIERMRYRLRLDTPPGLQRKNVGLS